MQSLRIKLIAPFLIGALALTLVLSAYTYTSARNAVKDAMLLISEAKTNHAASSMSLLIKSMSTSLQNMVVDQHVTSLFLHSNLSDEIRQQTNDWLEIIAENNEYYRDAFIVDINGICISSSNPGHIGEPLGRRPFIQVALGGRFNLGESSVGRVTKKFSVFGAGPIDVGGHIVGALVLVNDFPRIVDYDSSPEFDDQGIFTAMLDEEGVFQSHIDKTLMGNSQELFPELYKQLAQVGEKGGFVTYKMNGDTYLGYAKVEPTIKWLVITSGEESKVFASAYRVGIAVFSISMAVLCLITFIVVRTANGILKSLLSLINFAKLVSEGNLDIHLEETRRKDELGILHSSLQRLVEALQSMLKETQAASKMKGEFLANMSHEIRTPLNAIIGMTHLSLRDTAIQPKQRGYLEKIQMAARSLLGIINDILDLSKIEAGKMELESMPFNLRDTLDNVLSMHHDAAAAKALDLELQYAQGTEEYFVGDPLRVSQVVNNLLSNAIKFTNKGGIIVRCWQEQQNTALPAWQEMPDGQTALAPAEQVQPEPPVMFVSVSDSGIGISEEAMSKLFQPFTQADASITRQFGGTGLGLAITSKLVSLLGGEISAASKSDTGTTFTFSMRLEPNPSGIDNSNDQADPSHAFELLALQGKVLLVAEDNTINQLIIQELIEPSGAEIVLVENGLQAVDAVRQRNFDLVLMDMQMPIMGGLEATMQIREFKPAADLPIVAVTANAMKEDKEKGFACGMNDYLTKPVEPDQLLDILKRWVLNGGKQS